MALSDVCAALTHRVPRLIAQLGDNCLCSAYPTRCVTSGSESPIVPASTSARHASTFYFTFFPAGWHGSRVVSVLDSGSEGHGFKSRSRRCRVTVLGTTESHPFASVHQAAKLVAACLRVAGVTAGLAESNGSLPPGL